MVIWPYPASRSGCAALPKCFEKWDANYRAIDFEYSVEHPFADHKGVRQRCKEEHYDAKVKKFGTPIDWAVFLRNAPQRRPKTSASPTPNR